MASLKDWVSAFRLRTLPLALASIGMGSFLASGKGLMQPAVFALCALTTVLLQILSNLANDYGDSVHGADSKSRQGPQRAVQSGAISPQEMKKAMYLFAGLSFACGLLLLWKALSIASPAVLIFFLGLGILCIAAAITYTAGARPYGYAGLGDISVFLFFGLAGVLGTYYLHTGSVEWDLLLPAASCGLFATGVLNINNIRDIESDFEAGKMSIPVRLGREKAKTYHWALLIGGMLCALAYTAMNYERPMQLVFLISFSLFVKNGKGIQKGQTPADFDPFLKQMAVSTLFFVLSFGVGQVM